MDAVVYVMTCAEIAFKTYRALLQVQRQKTILRPGVNEQAQHLQQSKLPIAGRSTPVC